jgi:hypothetical protein
LGITTTGVVAGALRATVTTRDEAFELSYDPFRGAGPRDRGIVGLYRASPKRASVLCV